MLPPKIGLPSLGVAFKVLFGKRLLPTGEELNKQIDKINRINR